MQSRNWTWRSWFGLTIVYSYCYYVTHKTLWFLPWCQCRFRVSQGGVESWEQACPQVSEIACCSSLLVVGFYWICNLCNIWLLTLRARLGLQQGSWWIAVGWHHHHEIALVASPIEQGQIHAQVNECVKVLWHRWAVAMPQKQTLFLGYMYLQVHMYNYIYTTRIHNMVCKWMIYAWSLALARKLKQHITKF